MSLLKRQQKRVERRKLRSRSSLHKGTKLRVSVSRSAAHIYAQVIDDNAGTTLATSSSLSAKLNKGDGVAIAHAVGLDLGKKAVKAGISDILFDRGVYLYHGRVKSLAEGLREAGLKF